VGATGDVTTERLVAFMSGGFRAPAPAPVRERSSV
jgi:hypothetical protein